MSVADSLARAPGVVRLLNTAGGRVLCLAGAVEPGVVEAFRRRYGAEPVPVDGIDARSVTALSPAALGLLVDHLDAARRGGRPVTVRRSALVERVMTAATTAAPDHRG